jgi:hypothetical protein
MENDRDTKLKNDELIEIVNPYLYEIGTCEKTGIKLVYRELDENMKNHPKYKLIQKWFESEKGVSDGNG